MSRKEYKNYSKYMNTFIFRKIWGEYILLFSDEDAGKLIKAVFQHTAGESASEYLQDRKDLLRVAARMIHVLETNSISHLEKIGKLDEIRQRIEQEDH